MTPDTDASRTDMLTAHLKLKAPELTIILARAGRPPKEQLHPGRIPGQTSLDQIQNNHIDLWTAHFQNTRPYPLDESNGSRRLLPLHRYAEYQNRIQTLTEQLRVLHRGLAAELLLARRELQTGTDLPLEELTQQLTQELTVVRFCQPTPTLERFLSEPPGATDPSLLYRNSGYPPDYRELVTARYREAISHAQRLGR